ncbi:DUF4493 domain-containing protein, partial [Xanthovirga aplysinae]|uniref:DUF4493 domain-containing protein n=1 Tax=Xanthovirga aplysinae TaxID=2529853 RepID=UPI0012BD0A0E
MRNYFLLWAPLLFSLLLFSCEKKELNEPEIDTGKLVVSIKVEENAVETSSFQITIFNVEGEEIEKFDQAEDMPEEIILAPGSYYITGHSPGGVQPRYEGISEEFSIQKGETLEIELTCNLVPQETITGPTGILLIALSVENEDVNTEGFQIGIFNIENEEIMSFGADQDLPEEISLEIGQYYIITHSTEDLAPLYYEGFTEKFEIKEGESLQIEVVCILTEKLEG